MSNFHGGRFGNPRRKKKKKIFSCTYRKGQTDRPTDREGGPSLERARSRPSRDSISVLLTCSTPRDFNPNRLSIFDRESSRWIFWDNLYLNTNANKIIGFACNLFIS